MTELPQACPTSSELEDHSHGALANPDIPIGRHVQLICTDSRPESSRSFAALLAWALTTVKLPFVDHPAILLTRGKTHYTERMTRYRQALAPTSQFRRSTKVGGS